MNHRVTINITVTVGSQLKKAPLCRQILLEQEKVRCDNRNVTYIFFSAYYETSVQFLKVLCIYGTHIWWKVSVSNCVLVHFTVVFSFCRIDTFWFLIYFVKIAPVILRFLVLQIPIFYSHLNFSWCSFTRMVRIALSPLINQGTHVRCAADKIFPGRLIIINRDYYTSPDIVIGEHVFPRNDHDDCIAYLLPTCSTKKWSRRAVRFYLLHFV